MTRYKKVFVYIIICIIILHYKSYINLGPLQLIHLVENVSGKKPQGKKQMQRLIQLEVSLHLQSVRTQFSRYFENK